MVRLLRILAATLVSTIYFMLLFLACPVASWGVKKGGGPFRGLDVMGSSTTSRMSMMRRATTQEDGEEDAMLLEQHRRRLERSFAAVTFDGDHHDPMGAFIISSGDGDDDNRSSGETAVVRALDRMYHQDATSTSTTDDVGIDYLCQGEACGGTEDDDDECKIPDSFKLVPGEGAVDVMAFLGIRRADPLKTTKAGGGSST